MDGDGKDGEANSSLEHHMKNLLKKIEQEPVPEELQTLAQELQAAIQRRSGPSDPKE